MKKNNRSIAFLVITASAAVCVPTAGHAQTPWYVGVHVGSNLSNFADEPIDKARIGAQAIVPISGPLSFYPEASLHLDGARWQLSGLARADFTSSGNPVPVYVGGGVSLINFNGPGSRFYDVLLTGLKAKVGPYQPFVELQFLDGIQQLAGSNGDFGVQLYFGVNASIP